LVKFSSRQPPPFRFDHRAHVEDSRLRRWHHVYCLRNKLAPYGIQIETMVNVGYRLAPAAKASERRRESAWSRLQPSLLTSI
jgi:hypothetical protein